MAVVVLAVLALGGGALIHHSRARIGIQRNRRAAIEIANARMEELMRAWDYSAVEAQIGATLTNTVTINGRTGYRRTTTVQDGGLAADDCLRITVTLEYRLNSGDTVTLETLRAE